MVRPKLDEKDKRKLLALRVSPDVRDAVYALAIQSSMSRAKALEYLVRVGLSLDERERCRALLSAEIAAMETVLADKKKQIYKVETPPECTPPSIAVAAIGGRTRPLRFARKEQP